MGSHFPLFLLLFTFSPLYGHVALTFPEARFPPLDFLDTSRTSGPCGVPKPRIPSYTNLLVGSTYNFTWRMQYPHQGGYRLLLLDKSHQTVEQLAPMNGLEYAGLDEQIAQFERVRFSQPCQECIVVLERQALEWGKSYKFMSCADVNILQSTAAGETVCNGRGVMENGRCHCDNGFTGNICQYQAHCEQDEDCENGGKCVTESSSLIMKTCYCAYGYFGPNCRETFNHPSDACFAYEGRDEQKYSKYGMFDASCYNREKLNDRDLVYFRKIKNDIEIVLDFETTSWISLGWRPEGLDPSCRLFPDLEGVSSRRAKRMSNIEHAETSEQQGEEIPPPSTPIRREPPPKKVIQEGPRPAMPKNNGMLDSALSAPMHAMDCVDIIQASVKDGRLRIGDMYSRDRSTPLDDSWFDGEMSLIAAAGVEIDGRTVVMFRRNIQEIEPTDHPLGPGRLFVIWAKGQTQGSYSHNAPSAVESSKDSNSKSFYPDDEVKYHGNKNRGIHPMDFTLPVKNTKPEVAFGVPQVHVKPATEPEPHPEPEPSPEVESSDPNASQPLPEPHPEPEPTPSGAHWHDLFTLVSLSVFVFGVL